MDSSIEKGENDYQYNLEQDSIDDRGQACFFASLLIAIVFAGMIILFLSLFFF